MRRDGESSIPTFERLLQDTLDTVVSAEVRASMLTEALHRGHYAELPADRSSAASFVTGEFRGVVTETLGASLAAVVLEEILRGLAHATHSTPSPNLQASRPVPRAISDVPSLPAGPRSNVRLNEAQRITSPASPEAARRVERPPLPVVVVATLEELLFETLTEWFEHRATVGRASSTEELLGTLAADPTRRVIVILDGKAPSLSPGVLANLLFEHPGVEFVLCRAAPMLAEAVASALPPGARWRVYGEPASLDHVAAECIRLVS